MVIAKFSGYAPIETIMSFDRLADEVSPIDRGTDNNVLFMNYDAQKQNAQSQKDLGRRMPIVASNYCKLAFDI